MTHETSISHVELVADLTAAVLDSARMFAPEIVMHGLREPHRLPIRPREFKRSLKTRLEVEQAIADSARDANSDNIGWSFSDGLYRRYDDAEWEAETPIGEQPLVPSELMVTDKIDKMLKEPDIDRPVVALDFGGGRGISWLRIAAKPKYRQAIVDKRLAMVVTNLGFSPSDAVDAEGYSGVARSMNIDNAMYKMGANVAQHSKQDMDWTRDHQDLVHYLDVNALELASASVPLSDGVELPLKGNVDIIHEQFALAHTHVPDLALASFNRILSQRGSLHSDAATYYHLIHPAQFRSIKNNVDRMIYIDQDYEQQRRLGLAIGSKMLQLHGFSYTNVADLHLGVFDRQPE